MPGIGPATLAVLRQANVISAKDVVRMHWRECLEDIPLVGPGRTALLLEWAARCGEDMPESQDDLFRGNRAWEALLEAHAVVDGWVDRVLSSPSGTNRRDDQGLHKRRKYLANRDMVAELFEGGVVGSKHKIVGLEDRTLDIPYTFFVSLLLDWPSVQRQLHAHADSGTDKAVRIRSANYRIESARSADAAAFVEDVILPLIQQMRPYSPPGEDGETEYTCAALLLFIDKLRKDNAWPTNDFALIRRSWVSDRINLASWVTAG